MPSPHDLFPSKMLGSYLQLFCEIFNIQTAGSAHPMRLIILMVRIRETRIVCRPPGPTGRCCEAGVVAKVKTQQ